MTRVMSLTYEAYDALCSEVQDCTKCSRMDSSARVLSRASGPVSADIMFIGEAPGRLGADESEIPFHGDQAGHNFEDLLQFARLSRAEIFVTNAVLCNPKDQRGNNAAPSAIEVHNCSGYLKRQLDLVNPKIVVTLGSTALKAVAQVQAHSLSLADSVRTANHWYGRVLVPLYHPGQRAMIHRSYANQRSDYQFVAELARRASVTPRQRYGKTRADVALVARTIIEECPGVSYFGLHKLLYLVEVTHVKNHGEKLTGAFFIRQKDGPYCVDVHPTRLHKALPMVQFDKIRGGLFVSTSTSDLFGAMDSSPQCTHELRTEIRAIVHRYRGLPDAELKTKVYLTAPMKRILRQEKEGRINLYNTPIEIN